MTADDRAAILARRAEVTKTIARRQRAAGQHELAKATEYSARAARTALAALTAKPAAIPEPKPAGDAESWSTWLTAEDARHWRTDAA